MKRSILLAFATLTIPFLAMAQSPDTPTPAPASGEKKPLIPGDPVPAPETPPVPPVVPAAPIPVPVPPVVPPAPIPVPVPPLVPPAPIPMPVPPVPVVPPAPIPMPVPPVVPPAPIPLPDLPPVAVPPVPAPTETPARPESNRRGPPGAKEKPGKPGKPGKPVPVPAPPALEADPKPNAEPSAPATGMKPPSARPAETDGSATPPAVTGTPPVPNKIPTDPSGRPLDPPLTPAPSPGTPMPALTPAPEAHVETKTAERPVPQQPPSQATVQVLEDVGKRDRQADAAQAQKIEGKDDAKRLIMTILGGVAASQIAAQSRTADRFPQGYRPPVAEVGRTQMDRERNVGSMVQRFAGQSPQAPQYAPSGTVYRETRNSTFTQGFTQGQRAPQFYDGNRRVVRYASMQEIPPVLVASQQLNRVQVLPQAQSSYNFRPQAPQQGLYYNDIPPSYTAGNAYAVSYSVDPNSAISRDDILFRQGSADFADAYSYDLVIDVAEAMNAPTLRNETFVIEGHASAEGDYGKNLLLSQERAERISREIVRHGVSPERLVPVGYGEAEAAHPANAPESERRLDRRVMVFRMR